MAPHGKELSEDLRIRIVALHKDGRGYKKFSNSLELSYSTVASIVPREIILIFLLKCEGCTHFCEILYIQPVFPTVFCFRSTNLKMVKQ